MEKPYSHIYEEVEVIKGTNTLEVLLVLKKDTKEFLVAKKANIYELTEGEQDEVFNECRLLKELNHPHVLKYKDIFLEEEFLIEIVEYCEEGDVANYLRRRMERRDFLSQKLILNWLLQILMALEYLHEKKIIHRGIRLENIYLNSKGNLKLGSFGESKVLTDTLGKALTIIGTADSMSPEMMDGKPYDSKTDMWAVGCVLYELCSYKGIFSHLALAEMYEHILEAKVPELPGMYSKHLQPIFKKLMKKQPASRASAQELLRMPIFLKLMEEYLKKKRIDSIEIKDVPVKRLKTHDKLLSLPPLKPKPKSSTISSPYRPKAQKKEPLRRSPQKSLKIPQIQSKRSPRSLSQDPQAETQEQRLTKRVDQQQDFSIQKLYKLQISLICKQLEIKYSPKMEQIPELQQE